MHIVRRIFAINRSIIQQSCTERSRSINSSPIFLRVISIELLPTMLFLFLLAACARPLPSAPTESTPVAESQAGATSDEIPVAEHKITPIVLEGPLAKKQAEISGLAWYEDNLILLPQHPTFDDQGSFLYTLPKSAITAYLDDESPAALLPQAIPFSTPDFAGMIDGFEGFEAIAFDGQDVYLTIEANTKEGMRGYLVQGEIMLDLSEIVIDSGMPKEILPQADLENQTYETLLVAGDKLLIIYEANGRGKNDFPRAFRFDKALAPQGTLPFPPVEYRITDATELDSNGRFWAANYYSGSEKFHADKDPIVDQFGLGPTHSQYDHLERLLEFQLTDSGISLSSTPPIQLHLADDKPRKWEGIVRLDGRGFLLATDKSPDTILGFVEGNTP